jgi:hypothetical protein
MALDSPEMMERMAAIALEHGVDAVILRPTGKTAWEYDKHGRLVQRDVSPLKVSDKGRRCYCMPEPEKGEGVWSCSVYDKGPKGDVALTSFTEQLPG